MLNNLLKDIGKLLYFSPLIEMGREVVAFITRHHYILAVFRKIGSKDLLKYSETRFAYNFLMLERLQDQKNALRQLVVSDEWTQWAQSHSTAGRGCSMTVLDDSFWDQVCYLLIIVSPIINMMRLVDGDEPCIGKVYEGLDKMVEHIDAIEEDRERFAVLRDLCQSRWDSYHSPLQAAAFVLDPEFQGKEQEFDREVTRGWEHTLMRLVPDATQRRLIKDQVAFYRSKQGLFGYADALQDRFLTSSALWWQDYGSDTPELQRLAIRILSQGASSSPVERLWSSFQHIAPKKRNKLAAAKANDLVFVNANLRLLNKQSAEFTPERFIGFGSRSSDDDSGASHEHDAHAQGADALGDSGWDEDDHFVDVDQGRDATMQSLYHP